MSFLAPKKRHKSYPVIKHQMEDIPPQYAAFLRVLMLIVVTFLLSFAAVYVGIRLWQFQREIPLAAYCREQGGETCNEWARIHWNDERYQECLATWAYPTYQHALFRCLENAE